MATTQASGGKTPTKSMSSRLLTMKFMQRAAASSPSSSPASARDEPSLKRRRISGHSSVASAVSDLKAVQDALAQEEAQRQEALARTSEGYEETRWELSYQSRSRQDQPLRVVNSSLTSIDSSTAEARGKSMNDNAIDQKLEPGRRSYGHFNRALEADPQESRSNNQSSDKDDSEKSDSDDTSSSQDEGIGDPMTMIRHEARKQDKKERKARKAAAKEAIASRKESKKLKRLTSISGTGLPMVLPQKSKGKRSLSENLNPARHNQRPEKRIKS